MTGLSTNGRAALAYAQRYGWPVHPLVDNDKTPRLKAWQKRATTDPATIRAWWEQWPLANVGIACSGLVVIDLDVKHGDGIANWRAFCEERGIDDATVEQITPSGGLHLVFATPNGADIGNSARGLPDGVDVRGNGGYIVAAPSRTAAGEYIWESAHHPEDRRPSPLPAALLELLTEKPEARAEPGGETVKAGAYAQRALESEVGRVALATKGERNETLNRAAFALGQLVGAGALDRATVEAALLSATGLPGGEARATIRSGLDGGAKEPRKKPTIPRMGTRLPAATAEAVRQIAPPPPDPNLAHKITRALLGTDTAEGEAKPPVLLRRRKAGLLLLAWLAEHGGFVQSPVGDLYFFYRDGRRLFELGTAQWAAWLYAASGANPAGTDFAYLRADCQAAALSAPRREVVRVAAWDGDAQVLRVSDFDGGVWVLDGETIQGEPNGEHVLFADDPMWAPYTPNFDEPGALAWLCDLPPWDGDGDAHALAFRAWILSSFFTELCPSRPLCVFIGEKGSGKSMSLRLLLRYMFGPAAQISGVPDRPDGFTAAAAAAHVLVLDNLDVFTGWLRDKLARLATGAMDEYRRLYTGNEVARVIYRCWLGFTARTPDTLRRDDLADRLLLLPVQRIKDADRLRETHLCNLVEATRGDWWGDVLTACNAAVATIRAGGLVGKSALRLADWEALSRVFARNEGQEPTWDRFVEDLKRAQSGFLLENNLIVEGLDAWLENPTNHGREVTSWELHEQLTTVLFGGNKPPSDWPKSAMGFAKRLAGIRRDLCTLFRVEWYKPTDGPRKNVWTYTFEPLP